MTKIGVLVSGGGTNLQAVIDRVHHRSGEIVVVIANNADAYGLTRAQNSGIPTAVVLESDFEDYDAFNAEIIRILKDKGVELVVLAGYMKIITPAFVEAYPNKIINIHPALIPSFCGAGYYGLHVHERALAYGVKITGATVHFVNEEPDGGPIVLQKAVQVLEGDTPELLQRRVMEQAEWVILPRAVSLFCQGRLRVEGRHVTILEEETP